MTDTHTEALERVARAIVDARCDDREGPYGGYDYGHNPDFYGPPPEGGRYVVRDFRDPSSPAWGAWVHQTDDRDEHEAALKRLTEHHIARAAIEALPARNDELLADCALCSHAGSCADNLRDHDGAFCANSLLPLARNDERALKLVEADKRTVDAVLEAVSKRSIPTMDAVWSAGWNSAMDFVSKAIIEARAALADTQPSGERR
jgi:hypothetical protein